MTPVLRAKQAAAASLVEEHHRGRSAAISVQVLQEYFNGATRKLAIAPDLARDKVQFFANWQVFRPDASDVIAAIELHRGAHISFWDALILHAARAVGASTLYTEDLQHGAILAGVRILNPFHALTSSPTPPSPQ
jgi:predicted nucleic acid-binding protein